MLSRPSIRHEVAQSAQTKVLKKLFPTSRLETLVSLSHHDLLNLAQDVSVQVSPQSDGQNFGDVSEVAPESEEEREWNEPQENEDPASAMCDDVNGLSLLIHRRSYMGISSVHAVLRTIFRLNPAIHSYMKQKSTSRKMVSSSELAYATSPHAGDPTVDPSIDQETSIDSYFLQLHEITPLLNEDDFRATWRQGQRSDGPWLALLNMVLVLGSLSAGGCDDQSHHIYYARAKQYLNLEFLGAGSVESLQALCLLGGYYLHYKNAPNMAHAIMGAAFRMAIALGLHRETANIVTKAHPLRASSRPQTRRKTWWSLFCLDTWGSMTLGRPSLGRWDSRMMNVSSTNGPEGLGSTVLSLNASLEFCMIATRVQDRFAELSPISTSEIKAYDQEVQTWYQNLPPELRSRELCSERLVTAQYFMCNRYLNLRLLLHRPVLISYANRKDDLSILRSGEQEVIQSCQDIACSAIDQIALALLAPNRLRVWNAVWYLYQATMVILLSLIVDPNHAEVLRWRVSIEKALKLFDSMEPWTKAADRSREVLASIYEASGIPNSGIDENTRMETFDFSNAEWDYFDLDSFAGDTNWESMYGFGDDFMQYPDWTDQSH